MKETNYGKQWQYSFNVKRNKSLTLNYYINFFQYVRINLKRFIMKKLIFAILVCVGMTVVSCSKDSCKECTGCKTLASATLCEDDFEKVSNYDDQVQNYESDGCTCNTK